MAILANANSKESVQLATYYAQKRGIPAGQICQLKMSQGEVMPRAEWDKVRTAFRQWVVGKKLHNKVRCVVTVWDVPLKIDKEAKESTSTRRPSHPHQPIFSSLLSTRLSGRRQHRFELVELIQR